MTVWLPVLVVVVPMVGTVGYSLAFAPWRMKRLAYWLMARSPRYRSYVNRLLMRRMREATQRFSAALAGLVPATKKATAAIRGVRKGVGSCQRLAAMPHRLIRTHYSGSDPRELRRGKCLAWAIALVADRAARIPAGTSAHARYAERLAVLRRFE